MSLVANNDGGRARAVGGVGSGDLGGVDNVLVIIILVVIVVIVIVVAFVSRLGVLRLVSGLDRLSDGARAVSDSQGGGLGDGVSLVANNDSGGARAVGGVDIDNLGGVDDVVVIIVVVIVVALGLGSSGLGGEAGDGARDGARAVGDGQSGGLGDGVSLVIDDHLGRTGAVGGERGDNLSGPGDVGRVGTRVDHAGGGKANQRCNSESLHDECR